MFKSKRQNEYAAAYAGLISQIGCITSIASVIIIAVAFFAGQFIDNYFGTKGIFTVLALVGSFPITLYVIVRIALSNVARAQDLLERQEDDDQEAETDT
ncbi:MAG: AtpZ/AtpI family protein [Anaerolineae bacterium]|nr:AtpZ/AtpI family protein [Anaerolineae bacterium]